MRKACRLVAASLQKDNIVIFKSTVYPGATEEECVPLLSEVSGLKFNVDYFLATAQKELIPVTPAMP